MKFKFNLVFAFSILILILFFVIAAPSAPTGLTFNNNVTSVYDEGNFSLNWTSGGGDAEFNYTIYIFADGTLFTTVENDSVTGYSFSNTTEANYTFIVEALNATSNSVNSSSNISITVDSDGPVITLPQYINGTAKKNTATLTLNISLSDTGATNAAGSHCLIDVNGTSNQTVVVSGGWCNSSSISLTGTSDGNSTLNIWANNSAGLWNLSNTLVVQVDTTNPTASASCSPSSVNTGNVVTCTCSGTDATSGVASSTASSTPSTSNSGTFTYNCVVTDNAGNSKSKTATYVVTHSSSGGGSSSTGKSWITHSISDEIFENGFTSQIEPNKRIQFKVGAENHYVGVVSVSSDKVTIEIASDPVQISLSPGEDAKADVTDDGFYDVYVVLNAIVNGKADLTIRKIHEAVPEGSDSAVETTGEVEGEVTGETETEARNLTWLWILVIFVILIIIGIKLKPFKR